MSSPGPRRRGLSVPRPGRGWWVPAWAVLLAVVLLGPALAPGLVLSYDMVWVPDLTLRSDFLGLGSSLPRAVPSDAVVSVLDEVVAGWVLQKLVLLLPLVGGALGVVRPLRDLPLPARLVAVSLFVWNPFVAERLVMGHWPVLVGYGVLPWVLLLGRRWRVERRLPAALPVLVVAGSLSASAGVVTAVALVASVGLGSRARAAVAVGLVAAANAPWVVSGLLHAAAGRSDPAGAAAFALSGEGSLPAPLAALSLGGIWNSEVVPHSRTGILAWVSLLVLLALAVAGGQRWWSRGRRDAVTLAICWGVGLGLALLTWASPDAVAWVAAHVPGGGLLRDGSRQLALCVPLVASLAAVGTARVLEWMEDAGAVMVAAALVLLPVLLLPDAALGVDGRLRAVDFPRDYAEARAAIDEDAGPGDVLLLPLASYRQPAWNAGRKVLDPTGRYQSRDFVTSDALVVSGTVIEGEDPRVAEVARALDLPTPDERADALVRAGIGVVITDLEAPGEPPEVAGEPLLRGSRLEVSALDGARSPSPPAGWLWAMAAAWAAFVVPPAGVAVAAVVRRRRRRDTP
ncbi:hypothetical protein [Nocardioides lijunqiniae]|uniref:hypothetical protein n=1 Tax=Nocardioides lijunqiniae TaxID=2760832 RepID=UPI001877A2DF|nr:hypothetical protein [Nocardioides lijunqiniae]